MKNPWTWILLVPVLASCLPPDRGQDLGDGILGADSVSCQEQRRALELAVEAYRAKFGTLPASEADLTPTFVVTATPDFEIAANADVVPSLTGRCT
jgi:hypothetical protein